MRNSRITHSAAAVLGAVLMQASPVHAGTSAANASGLCQSALPVFDTNIRKRPLAVANESSGNAFVSCSVPVGYNPDSIDNAVVFLTNRGSNPVDVACTFVDGVAGAIGPDYYPQTVTLPPGDLTPVIWDPATFSLPSFSGFANFSCNLPPNVEMNLVGFDYTDSP